MRSWRRTTEEGFNSLMVILEVDAPVVKVLDVITSAYHRKAFDLPFESEIFKQRIDDYTWLGVLKINRVAIVASRYFANIYHYTTFDDGMVQITVFSDDREDLAP